MNNNYKSDEKYLKNCIEKFVKPIDERNKIKLLIYYKIRRLRIMFINNRNRTTELFNVVYKYVCNSEPCNGSVSYMGLRIQSLKPSLNKVNLQIKHYRFVSYQDKN